EEALHRSPRPSAEVFPVKRSRTTGAGVFPVKRSSSRSAIDRRDDEVALWLIALAVRLHAPPLAQVFMDDAPLRRGHRVELHGPPVPDRLLRGVVGVGPQHLGATLAIPIGVDRHPHARWPLGKHDALGQMLDGVDRLPVFADEKAHVLALDAAAQHALAFLHLHLDVQSEPLGDFLEQLLELLRGLELLLAQVLPVGIQAVAHRRLPERFFFFRGGRGGGAAVAPVLLTPASGGSALGLAPLVLSGLPLGDPPPPPASGPLPGGAGWLAICRLIKYCCPI